MPELNKKQKEFIDNYFICNFNATKAYRLTYPDGAAYAHANAAKLKAKPHVRAEINRRLAETVGDREELANKVLFKLNEVAFEDMKSEEVPIGAQLKAVELLGKQLGLYTQKIDANVNSVVVIDINVVDDEDGD